MVGMHGNKVRFGEVEGFETRFVRLEDVPVLLRGGYCCGGRGGGGVGVPFYRFWKGEHVDVCLEEAFVV